MTFNTPGYLIDSGNLNAASSQLNVTTNAEATINLAFNSSNSGTTLVKNGLAPLAIGGVRVMDLQINQGEARLTNSTSVGFSLITLANAPGVVLTLGQTGNTMFVPGLAGGGALGGVVRPDDQARTVTLSINAHNFSFGGTLEDNGAGILALSLDALSNQAQTLTNVNTYSGPTSINESTLAFTDNGSAVNTSMSLTDTGTLLLDNRVAVVSDRISDTYPVTMDAATLRFIGNNTTSVEEHVGPLKLVAPSTVKVEQPGAAPAQLTFAGLQREGHATLNIVGPGVQFAGLTNGSTGIVAPYVTAGNEWATVGGDGRITPLSTYATDINAGAPSDQVKLAASGTTTLAASTTRASLNLQKGGQVLDLDGHSLELTSGGLLSSDPFGSASSTIKGGSLSTPAAEMVVTANNNLTITSSITQGGGNPTTLVKSGPGVLALAGTNAYSGNTAIVQGTLVVSSDANLGLGSTIELGGTLRAAAAFSSAKGFELSGNVDTGSFNVEFSGPNNGSITKFGTGKLTLTNPATGLTQVSGGVLALPNATSGHVALRGGTLQAAGSLSEINATYGGVLDLGGVAPATLQTDLYCPTLSVVQIEFGIGSGSSDFLAISELATPFSIYPFGSPFLFDFHNLGGVMTGVDYPLVSFPVSGANAVPGTFGFAPDAIAAGWAGTFILTSEGVSVRFASVPEPASYLLAAFGCVGLAAWNWRRRRS